MTPATWTFKIPGPPVAKQRPRMNRATGNVYTPTRTKAHEKAVYYSMKQAGVKLQPGRMYGVKVEFYLSALRADGDNMLKCLFDGMFPRVKGEADDKQVTWHEVDVIGVQDATEERTVVTISDRGPMHQWIREGT